MASIVTKTELGIFITLKVDEGEARFLDALVGYGGRVLVETVKKHLGESYIKGHEEDGIRFCENLRQVLPGELGKLDSARAFLKGPADGKIPIGYS